MEKRKRPVRFTPGGKQKGGCQAKDEIGMFHCWGSEVYDCRDNGLHSHTIAIVEDEKGQIHQIDPKEIKFTDK